MDTETARIEHLKLIQSVIDRMGRNSFAIKGGALTAVAGLLAVAFGIDNWLVSAIGMFPVVILWGLDAFFVRQERIFRQLYDETRTDLAPEYGSVRYFSMNTQQTQLKVHGVFKIMFSRTLPFFYVPLLVVLVIVLLVM